ncbi:hypothetical protein EI94DRAFT_1812580 [Lactarius quietus]|nr:hypothetical protein EI94DRAFT_1812580 [Lactarius quietus]
MELPLHVMVPSWHSMLLSKTILRLVRKDALCAVDMAALSARTGPLRALGSKLVQEGRAEFAITMLSDINFTGLSFRASSSPKLSTPHHVAWALFTLVCSAQARAFVTVFKNVNTQVLKTQNSSTVAFFAHSFPCYSAIDSSAALRRSQSFPCACAGDVLLLGLARQGSTRRVEVQLGGSLLPTSPHIRGLAGEISTGLLRCWATRQLRTPTDTHYGLKVLVRAQGAHIGRHIRASGNIILDGQATYAQSRCPRHLGSMLRTLLLLVEEHGFFPGCITTNIVIKAALRSSVLDMLLVRQLFHYLAWSGYVRKDAGARVPFGSSESAMRDAPAVLGACIPVTKLRLSSAWHVKLLGEMFIKTLYLRKDVAGASATTRHDSHGDTDAG